MQTFLPYPEFGSSAKCLDRLRLGKQRVEAYQILRILLDVQKKKGWRNHPAVLMWKGYEQWLVQYIKVITYVWCSYGYKDSIWDKTSKLAIKKGIGIGNPKQPKPKWLGNMSFHIRHKSNLLRKKPEHYRKFWPKLSDSMEYLWPVTKDSLIRGKHV